MPGRPFVCFHCLKPSRLERQWSASVATASLFLWPALLLDGAEKTVAVAVGVGLTGLVSRIILGWYGVLRADPPLQDVA